MRFPLPSINGLSYRLKDGMNLIPGGETMPRSMPRPTRELVLHRTREVVRRRSAASCAGPLAGVDLRPCGPTCERLGPPIPNLAVIDSIAAHFESYSSRDWTTNRTARSFSSCGYLCDTRAIGLHPHGPEPPDTPRFQGYPNAFGSLSRIWRTKPPPL
jgi:hypothetical protein